MRVRVTERVPGRPDKPTIRRAHAGSTTPGGTLQLLRFKAPRIFPSGRKRTLKSWTGLRHVRDGAQGPVEDAGDLPDPGEARLPDQDPGVQVRVGEAQLPRPDVKVELS